MDLESEEWTTFTTRFGNYMYQVLPFGLYNGPADYQRFINNNFIDMLNLFVSIYLDDILIYSDTYEEHVKHLEVVL